jgi:putative DNA primase/helicase
MSDKVQYEKRVALLDAYNHGSLAREVVTVKGSSLIPRPVQWLFYEWLAKGKFHILAGAPGVGKTTVAMAFAATVSSGGIWPNGERCAVGNVLIWSGEDDVADTLCPRLLAMGGNPDNVYFVTGMREGTESLAFDPAQDMPLLTAECARIGNVSLIIVDPCSTTIQGDSHKNSEARKGLQPLVDLAESVYCAVLGITHFSKGGAGGDPTQRVIGSVAFAAVARVVLVAAKSKNSEGRETRLLCRSKSNIGADEGGYEYELEQIELSQFLGVQGSRILWGSAVVGTARELLKEPETESVTTAMDEAKVFLLDLLDVGRMSAKVVLEQAHGAGISKNTLYKAKTSLGILPKKGGMNEGWYWQLPGGLKAEDPQENAKIPIQNIRVSSRNDGDLRVLSNSDKDTLYKIYMAHYCVCKICIVGEENGNRCEQGADLWLAYQGNR